MDIKILIKKFEANQRQWSRLSAQLSAHFDPIVEKLVKKKDIKGLEALLNEIPDSLAKMHVYQVIHEVKQKLK
jgi:hypothetical protein